MAMPSHRRWHHRLIAFFAALVPRAIRDEWHREWEAELDHHESELRTWRARHVGRQLLVRSASAIWDVLWLQRRRLEEEMVQDIRFGLRLLVRSPAFTVAAVLSLAIGIGANTAVFTLINAALVKPLPYPDVDRLVAIRTEWSQHFSIPAFVDLAAASTTLDHLAATETLTFVIGDDQPEQVHGQLVSAEFAPLVGLTGPLRPIHGRSFSPDEFEPGSDRVVLLSHRLWTRRYGSDVDIIGRAISIDATPATVIGVLPPNFDFFATGDLLRPLVLGGPRLNDRLRRSLEVIGRLKPGATVSQATAQLTSVAVNAAGWQPAVNGWAVSGPRDGTQASGQIQLEFVRDLLVKDFRRTLVTMWAVAGLVLLIGCCNFANLLSARTLSRAHELAVRTALGARRQRVTRQLAVEALLLGFLGGIVGLVFAVAGRNLLVAATSQHFLGASTISFDWRVLVFATVIALTTGLIFGLIPALRANVMDWPGIFGVRNTSSARGLARSPRRGVSTTLAAAEVGLTLVLLVGASLLVKSMMQLERFEPGYDTAATTLGFELPSTTYPDNASVARFVALFDEAVRAIPGVSTVGAASSLPLAENTFRFRPVALEGGPIGPVGQPEDLFPPGFAPPPPPPPPPGDRTEIPDPSLQFFPTFSAEVGPGFFDAMGVPLVSGRDVGPQDTTSTQPVVVVNQAFADRYWPGATAVGKRIRLTPIDPWITVVGVVGNIRRFSRDDDFRPEIYRPFTQQVDRRRGDRRPDQADTQAFVTNVSFVVRTTASPDEVRRSAQAALASIDPALPIGRLSTLQEDLERTVASRRFLLRLFFAFGTAAIALAALGVYGVTAYTMRRRMREMAVRVALGASPQAIAGLVVRQGLFIALYGVTGGLALAFALSGFLRQYLYEVQPFDAWLYGGIAALLTLVVLLASYVPARRASRLDPLAALKQE